KTKKARESRASHVSCHHAISTGIGSDRLDGNLVVGHMHLAVGKREERIVAADADVLAGLELRAALADDDRAGGDDFAGIGFDAQVLRVGVAAVARRALTFLMCHVAILCREFRARQYSDDEQSVASPLWPIQNIHVYGKAASKLTS